MVGGIDEAGRGPVIGPMIICGAWIRDESVLKSIGVRDSKELSKERREELFKELMDILDGFKIEVVMPWEIDKAIEMGISLNRLELLKFSKIAKSMPVDIIYVDAPDTNEKRFEERMRTLTGKVIKAEHNADKKYLIVGAASIIAKVIRDKFIELIKEEIGDFGSGYPSDPKTKEFLEKNFEKVRNYKYIRKSWDTYRRLENTFKQRTLFDFI